MKAQTVIAEEVTLSQGEALKAFRGWISAELLTQQCHWLGAESRRQKRTKTELLTEALGLWVRRHPEQRLTKPALFNLMRAAVGEFMAIPPSEAGFRADPGSPLMTIIDERDLTRVRGIIADLVQDYQGSKRACDEAYRIMESFLRRSTVYTRSQLTLPMLEGICREAAHLYPLEPNAPSAPRLKARAVFPFAWLSS